MQIHWQGAENQHGVIDAKATWKQDFLRVSMEVRSARSESQTLIAQPRRDPESGTPLLYYVYLVSTKARCVYPAPPYRGAAILRFIEDGGGELRGNYWTSQLTSGHFQMHGRTKSLN